MKELTKEIGKVFAVDTEQTIEALIKDALDHAPRNTKFYQGCIAFANTVFNRAPMANYNGRHRKAGNNFGNFQGVGQRRNSDRPILSRLGQPGPSNRPNIQVTASDAGRQVQEEGDDEQPQESEASGENVDQEIEEPGGEIEEILNNGQIGPRTLEESQSLDYGAMSLNATGQVSVSDIVVTV